MLDIDVNILASHMVLWSMATPKQMVMIFQTDNIGHNGLSCELYPTQGVSQLLWARA